VRYTPLLAHGSSSTKRVTSPRLIEAGRRRYAESEARGAPRALLDWNLVDLEDDIARSSTLSPPPR
jgi:hypothetical protein